MLATNNLLKKKETKKNLNALKQCNHSSYEFLEYIKQEKDLNKEELENLNNLQSHLLNMNVLFSDMQKAMK